MDDTEAWAIKNFKWWAMPFVDVMTLVSMLPKMAWVGDWMCGFVAKHGVKNGS